MNRQAGSGGVIARWLRMAGSASALVLAMLCASWLLGDATPVQAQSLVITKTVGTQAGCPSTQEITVPVGTRVNYCVKIHNTSQVTFTQPVLQITDPTLRVTYVMTPSSLPPGLIIERTSANISRFGQVRHLVSVTNTAYLTATVQGSVVATAQATARAHLVAPVPLDARVLITKTVGLVPGVCATGNQVVINRGQPVYYCFTVTNVGNVPYTKYEYNDVNLQISGASTTDTFWPGDTITRTNTYTNWAKLGPVTPTVSITNTVLVEATGPYAGAEDIDRAHVTVLQPTPAPAIAVAKTVGLASSVCAASPNILIQPSTPVYFCISVRNTGNVNLTQLIVRDFMQKDPPLTAVITRTTTLEPGEVVTFTNTTQGLSFLGNVVQTADFTNLVDVEASGPGGGADGSAAAFVDVFPANERRVYLPLVDR
jgi:hypothetical protein